MKFLHKQVLFNYLEQEIEKNNSVMEVLQSTFLHILHLARDPRAALVYLFRSQTHIGIHTDHLTATGNVPAMFKN